MGYHLSLWGEKVALGQWRLFYKGLVGLTANRPPQNVFKSMTVGLSRESGAEYMLRNICSPSCGCFYCMIYLRWRKGNIELLLIGVRLLNQFHVPCTNHNFSLKCNYISPVTQEDSQLWLQTILKICCEVILWRLSWQQGEADSIPAIPPFYSHTAAIIQNLWLSPQKGCNYGWKWISGTSEI